MSVNGLISIGDENEGYLFTYDQLLEIKNGDLVPNGFKEFHMKQVLEALEQIDTGDIEVVDIEYIGKPVKH